MRLDGKVAIVTGGAQGIGKAIAKRFLAEGARVFLASKYAAPALRASRGVILNMASTRAMISEPDTAAYSASKGGIVALTHSLGISLGPDVRVNCISPGWIDVSGWKKRSARPPEEVAAAALFLCSEEAGFITGENLVLDGGMARKMIYAP